MKQTILYVWKSPYPWDVRVEKICKSLSNSYRVILLARWGGEQYYEEMVDGFTVRRAGFQKNHKLSIPISANPLWKKEIEKAISDYDIDLIIVREIMLGTVSGKLAKKHQIPIIMDMAENYPALIKLFKKYKQGFLKKLIFHKLDLAKRVEQEVLKNIKNILVVVPEQIERLKSEGFDEGYNYEIAENAPFFSEGTNLNKTDSKLILGHHGFMSADKNIFKFIKALIELLHEGMDLEFHILGQGEVYEDTKKIIDDSGFQEKIILYGKWDKKMYERYLDRINYGVLPYDINDFTNTTNFNKFYDFLQVGLPVIASKTKPMSRIINDRNCGILIEINDKESVKQSIRDLNKLNYYEIANNSYLAFKNKHNWDCEEERLLNFVKKVIS